MKFLAVAKAVLGGVGCASLFLAAVARIDSREGYVLMDVLIGLLLAVSYALPSGKKPVRPKRSVVIASIVWAVVSVALIQWHRYQIYLRSELNPRWYTQHQIRQIHYALNNFYTDCGSFPSEQQGLSALSSNPGIKEWEGPYLDMSGIPGFEDAWRHPLQYTLCNGEPIVWSLGPDGRSGTNDDVTGSLSTD